jgi:molybdopterin molybdotransferase
LEIDEAQERIMAAVSPLPAEAVPLFEAVGRHLAEPLRASRDEPAFDNSAMDGYAVRAADVAGADDDAPLSLPVVGESRAGGGIPSALAPASAMRIFTGAAMPEGADAVVIQEDTARDGDVVHVRFASPVGHHVRARGNDARAGDELMERGARVTPGAVGLFASQGQAEARVHRRPVVAILSTGDELRELGETLAPGMIYDSNRHMLAALVSAAGATPRLMPKVSDDVASLATALEAADDADVVLTTGGVSVGDHDHVRPALERLGLTIDLFKVRIKPGKPLTFAQRARGIFVGLPGNPASALVTFTVFVRPALRLMLGDPAPFPDSHPVRLAHDHRRKPGRPELARAIVTRGPEGPVATLFPRQGSANLRALGTANALLLLPREQREFSAGETLLALPLFSDLGAPRSPFA